MESAALYTLAAKHSRKALSILTGEVTTLEKRQTTFNDMIVFALEAAVQE